MAYMYDVRHRKTGSHATPFKANNSHRRTAATESAAQRDVLDLEAALSRGRPDGSPAADAVDKKTTQGPPNGGIARTGDDGIGPARKRLREEEDEGEGTAAAAATADQRRLPRQHQEQRRGLPIFSHKASIIQAIKKHQVTGSYIQQTKTASLLPGS